jgi:hypothetical protein
MSLVPQRPEDTEFTPEFVKAMGEVIDTVWAEVALTFAGQRTDKIALAQTALVDSVMHVVRLGHRDPDVVAWMARRMLTAPTAGKGPTSAIYGSTESAEWRV